jgi:hypothetical protein
MSNQPRPSADFDLWRLIAIGAYTAYSNSLVGNPAPKVREYFERVSHPQVGDVVLEMSTVWRWAAHAVEAPRKQYPELGVLLRVTEEPFPAAEGEEPDPTVTETVHYIQPLDGSVPEYRWTNARFIQVPDALPRG